MSDLPNITEAMNITEAIADLDDAGPGGICDDCGHFAFRHHDTTCHFPRETGKECKCKGMLWRGHRLKMDYRTGPVKENA
jgi:hypothetical protein